MIWVCDEGRENKSSKSGYENKRGRERGRGRPKKRWLDTIKKDMRAVGM